MALATGIRVVLLPGMTGSAIMEYSIINLYNKNTSFRYIYQKEVLSYNTQYRIVPAAALKKII